MALDLNSTYKYRVLFVNQAGLESDYVEMTASTSGAENALQLYNIPTLGSDVTGISRRIYRTEGNGSTFKYRIEDNGRSTSLLDFLSDGSLGANYSAYTTTDFNSSIVWSEIQKPSSILNENILSVFPDDGDLITGLVNTELGVIVFKKNSIRIVYTEGSSLNWRVESITDKIGSDQPDSIKRARDKIYFMSHEQIYRYPDVMETSLSLPKFDTFEGKSFVDAGYISSKNWYSVILRDGSTESMLVYDEKAKTWYEFSGLVNAWECVIEKEFGSDRGKLICGHNGINYVTYYNTGDKKDYSDVSTSNQVTSYIKTKTFTDKTSNHEFRPRKLLASYKKTDGLSVTHNLTNPEIADSAAVIDSTDSTLANDYKNLNIATDFMTNSIESTNKINYMASGSGLEEFNSIILKGRILNRGKR